MLEQNIRNKKLLGKHNKSYAYPVYLEDFNPQDFVIIDIRHPEDFAYRHLKNALNIIDINEIAKLAQENPDKKILLHCYSGHTASIYGSELVNIGLENVYYMDENIMDFESSGLIMESSINH